VAESEKEREGLAEANPVIRGAEMIEIALANGDDIGECLEKVLAFRRDDASYEAYDLLDIAQDNSLADLDILVANNIRARMDGRAFLSFKRNRERIERALDSLPVDVALDDPWAEEYSMWQAIENAYRACWDEHVREARVTKVLHKKRPQLIPLVDGLVVIGRYYANYPGPRGGVPRMVAVTRRIREDMMRNTSALRELETALQDRDIRLTRVRLFDVLLWMGYPG